VTRDEIYHLVRGTCEAFSTILVQVSLSERLLTVVLDTTSEDRCEDIRDYLRERLPLTVWVEVCRVGMSEHDRAIGRKPPTQVSSLPTYVPDPAYYGLGPDMSLSGALKAQAIAHIRAELDRPYTRNLDATTKRV
jgi:hypothetical protein